MSTKLGINGFGRMGRLALRAAWDWPELEFVHVNELEGDAETAAHLITFDSIHGRWERGTRADGDSLKIEGASLGYTSAPEPGGVAWGELGVEVVLECTGRFRTRESLMPYFERGAKKVIVAAPVQSDALNVVVGVNDHLYDPDRHDVITAASCTTNCLAPVVKVIHEGLLRPACRDSPVGPALPVAGARGLPVGVGDLRPRRGGDLDAAADPHREGSWRGPAAGSGAEPRLGSDCVRGGRSKQRLTPRIHSKLRLGRADFTVCVRATHGVRLEVAPRSLPLRRRRSPRGCRSWLRRSAPRRRRQAE